MRCTPSEPVRWQLEIGTPAIDRVDVVTVHVAGANRR
jgi:hypothetical protein